VQERAAGDMRLRDEHGRLDESGHLIIWSSGHLVIVSSFWSFLHLNNDDQMTR
jgi:hypothetical protein